ncbi:MAG: response regulator transcription factor [Clostridiales bacterium]|nr:response regulator transcription factor [Clostridiales bacterium]
MYNILICDDDKDIVSALEIYLSGGEYQVFKAYSGEEALDILSQEKIHLVLMDIMMPHMDGIRATQELRKTSNVPVLFLTAKGEDTDKIQGLNAGGDDYITKPFNPMEVLARVRSQLRRYTVLGGEPAKEGILTVGPIELDTERHFAMVDGEPVTLTPLEYDILHLLMERPGQVFSVRQIYERVWKDPVLGSDNTVAVHIRHLREKIEIDPSHPRYLKVVWGVGYKLERS